MPPNIGEGRVAAEAAHDGRCLCSTKVSGPVVSSRSATAVGGVDLTASGGMCIDNLCMFSVRRNKCISGDSIRIIRN